MPKKNGETAGEPKIVQAVGSASNVQDRDALGNRTSANTMQDVMAQAVQKALSEGITDPDEIRKRQLDARQAYKDQVRQTATQTAGNA